MPDVIGEALKDFARYLPARLLPALVAIAAVPALTRLLPPSEYGRYTLVLTGVSLFSALTSSWITASAIRFLPGYEQSGELGRGVGLLLLLFMGTLIGGALALGAVGILMASRGAVPGSFVALGITLCVITALHDFLLGLLRSRRRASAFSALTSTVGISGYVLAVVIAALVQRSAGGVVTGFLLAVAIVFPLSARVALGDSRLSIKSPVWAEASEILRYGMPALVISGMTWVTSLSDRYVLVAAQGEHAVGIYAASRDLSDKPLLMLNTLVLLASTPVGIGVWESKGEAAASAYVTDLTRYYLVIAVPLAVGISVLAQPLIEFLADSRYHDGYRLVPLVAAGSLFAGLAARYTLGLQFRKRTDLMSYCYVGAALLNVAMNLIFVPRFGYMAAAVANLLSLALLCGVARFVSQPLFAWSFPAAASVRVVAAAAVMGAAVMLSTRSIASPGLQLSVGVPLGAATYTLGVMALGVVQPNERTALTQLFKVKRSDAPPPL